MSTETTSQLTLPSSRDIPVFEFRAPLHGTPARITNDIEARQLVGDGDAVWVNRGTAIQLRQSGQLTAAA